MKIVTHDCALVVVSQIDGTDAYFELLKKWPFADDRCQEQICYAFVMGLKMLYEKQLTSQLPAIEFVCFVKELLKSQLKNFKSEKSLKDVLFSDAPKTTPKKKKKKPPKIAPLKIDPAILEKKPPLIIEENPQK